MDISPKNNFFKKTAKRCGALLVRGKEEIKNFDIFALGNSAVLYYFFIFGSLSLLTLLPFISRISPITIGHGVQTLGYEAVFYLVIGISSFILGYRLSIGKILTKKIPNILEKEWNNKKVFYVFISDILIF